MAGTTGRQISRRARLTIWTAIFDWGADCGFPRFDERRVTVPSFLSVPIGMGDRPTRWGRRYRTEVAVDRVMGRSTAPGGRAVSEAASDGSWRNSRPGSRRASWVRDLTPSFLNTLPRWYSTVLGLMNSCSAISLLVEPSAASFVTRAS